MSEIDHPFRNAFKCRLWVKGTACLCPAWLSVTQEHDKSTGEPSSHVTGCAFQLLPWLLTGPIVKSSQVLDEVGAMRKDVQHAQRIVGDLSVLARIGVTMLAAARDSGNGQNLHLTKLFSRRDEILPEDNRSGTPASDKRLASGDQATETPELDLAPTSRIDEHGNLDNVATVAEEGDSRYSSSDVDARSLGVGGSGTGESAQGEDSNGDGADGADGTDDGSPSHGHGLFPPLSIPYNPTPYA